MPYFQNLEFPPENGQKSNFWIQNPNEWRTNSVSLSFLGAQKVTFPISSVYSQDKKKLYPFQELGSQFRIPSLPFRKPGPQFGKLGPPFGRPEITHFCWISDNSANMVKLRKFNFTVPLKRLPIDSFAKQMINNADDSSIVSHKPLKQILITRIITR